MHDVALSDQIQRFNRGGASGAQVLALAQAVQQQVWQRFAVTLEIEPDIIAAPASTVIAN